MILLQVAEVESFGIFKALAEYGVLGLVTLALGTMVWFLLRREIASEDKLREKVEELQKELTKYVAEDRAEMIEVLKDTTEALKHLERTIDNLSRR